MPGCGMSLFLETLERRRLMAAGDLDLTFGGGDGFAIIDTEWTDERARRVLVRPDGKIILGGSYLRWERGPTYGEPTDDPALARFNADGSIDASFGANGLERLNWNYDEYSSYVTALANGRDGELVVLAYSHGEALIKRGDRSNHFDHFGFVPNATPIHFSRLGVGHDGDIVLTGYYRNELIPSVGRLTPELGLDATFAKGGIRRLDFSRHVHARATDARLSQVVVQPDGKILVGGLVRRRGVVTAPTYFAVARLNADGSLDRSFGERGKVVVKLPERNRTYESAGMVRQSNGRIVLAATTPDGQRERSYLLRLKEDGGVDRKYGRGGFVHRSRRIAAIALQSDDKLLVGEGRMVWRYDRSGARDDLFGTDGRVDFTKASGGAVRGGVTDLGVQADGRIIVSVTRVEDGYGVIRLLAE